MRRPLIGVTTGHTSSEHGLPLVSAAVQYIRVLEEAGAAPVLIPSNLTAETVEALLSRLDGVLFTGGGDIAPERFHGKPHPRVYRVDTVRDEMELALAQRVVQAGVPFFGICRGHQVLNVALGGTLYTHIADQHPNAIEHSYHGVKPRSYRAHPVQVSEESHLSRLVHEPVLWVNSLHHQGVREVGAGLRAVAFAPDGLVEALELPDHPFGLSVQWHPEWLTDDAASQALFRAFVEACRA